MAKEALNSDQKVITQDETGNKRERSTIEFPYLDLDDAVEIAKNVHELGGNSCQWDQLAARLNLNATGGGFRLKVMTARTFGLVTYNQQVVTLTPLGARVCDPQQEKAAKADAFLNVPLYKGIHEQFKGITLPPPAGLGAAMVAMGVSPKQKEKARQVFQRSAAQGGFFAMGQGRLVYPAKGSAELGNGDEKPERREKKKEGDSDSDEDQHPFIEGLIKTLPKPDSDWPIEARKKWLQAASNIFDLIYADPDSKGSLKIEIQKDSAK